MPLCCKRCHQEIKGNKTGKRCFCTKCKHAKSKAQAKAYYADNKPRMRAVAKKYRKLHAADPVLKAKTATYHKKWYEKQMAYKEAFYDDIIAHPRTYLRRCNT